MSKRELACQNLPVLPDGFQNGFYTRIIVTSGCASASDYKRYFPQLKTISCHGSEMFDADVLENSNGPSAYVWNGPSLEVVFGLAFVGAFLGVLLGAFVLLGLCCIWCRFGRPIPHRGPVHRLASGQGDFPSSPRSVGDNVVLAVANDTA